MTRVRRTIENPILNSPYDEPARCFRFDDDGITDEVVEGRRRSEHFVAVPPPKRRGGKAQQEIDFLDVTTEHVEENKLINQVRSRVELWRNRGYPGVKPYESLAKTLRADIDEAVWATLYSTESRPFPSPETGQIAVKVINHFGDEVMQVYDV